MDDVQCEEWVFKLKSTITAITNQGCPCAIVRVQAASCHLQRIECEGLQQQTKGRDLLFDRAEEDERCSLRLDGSHPAKSTRKEFQYPFRLLNTLFSDTFAKSFGALGKKPARLDVEVGNAGNHEPFWTNPELNGPVEADLPEAVFLESEGVSARDERPAQTPRKRKKDSEEGDDGVSVLSKQAEVAQRKITFMDNQEQRSEERLRIEQLHADREEEKEESEERRAEEALRLDQ